MMRPQRALGRIILWGMATGWILSPAQAVSPGNGVTVTEASGSSQTDRPMTLSRVFAQGDIPNFAKARVGGLAVPTQCDVKTRWPDGSVQHAIISFQVTLPASGLVEVDFINQAGGNNGAAPLLEQASLPGGGADGRVPGQVHKTKVNSLQIRSVFRAGTE